MLITYKANSPDTTPAVLSALKLSDQQKYSDRRTESQCLLSRQVELAIEPTRLADIPISLRQWLTPEDVYIAVTLDEKRMARRGIITARVVSVVQRAKLRKVKLSRVTHSKNFLYAYPADLNTLEIVVKVLEDVVVKGQVLEVEAARRVVIDEMLSVKEGHGVEMNIWHVMLLADVMTNRGEVFGYQRNGMAKAKNSVLFMASFERTGDYVFGTAHHGQDDKLTGVTESIILGNPTRLGTGTFDLLSNRWQDRLVLSKRPVFLIK
ncbi:DNA-directed RNA polymerase subunit [Fasciolopsis buskii]|uniref:DNA-directed RNA polymerase n=1 Tax=Fasciolopsis buskii TaxID=27845 RepID=A0A8E0S291_9TREM|nr:DNA-directed RNA polymerase subunit [Fasciolopsis buski]